MNGVAVHGPRSELRKVAALMRVEFLSATSYRLRMVLGIAGLAATLVPLFFVAEALQPVVADSIREEGERYYGFLLVGMAALGFVTFALRSIEGPIASGIGTGTLEALLATPTTLSVLLAGLMGYDFLRTVGRALLLMAALLVAGTSVTWSALPLTLVILALITAAYLGVGLVAAALHLAFRTSGPLLTGTMTVSALLGGAYYSTTVVPAVIEPLTHVVPLTYGLRALRQSLLHGASFGTVALDVAILSGLAVLLLAVGALAMGVGLRHARRAGTLTQY
jgi:ABC-2 type transport system permease protein